MNKKAQESFTIVQYIPRMIFLIIVLFSVVFLVRSYILENLDVKNTQAELFINRIYYSPNGISYYDTELKRAIPGIVDPKLITNENLDALMNFNDANFIAGKITLFDVQSKAIASAVYNSQTYDRWKPISQQQGFTGAGAVTRFNRTIVVNFIDEGKEKEGMLKFEVLLPGK